MEDPGLGLNEAILEIVNGANLSSPLEVYYQTNECYGCPLTKLNPITNNNNQPPGAHQLEQNTNQRFVISTSYNFQLELRQLGATDNNTFANNTTSGGVNGCRLEDLSLNSHGKYRVDVSRRLNSDGQSLLCSLRTTEPGECLLCPFAVLISILLTVTVLELLYNKFWPPRRQLGDQRDEVLGRKLSAPNGVGPSASSSEAKAGGEEEEEEEQELDECAVPSGTSATRDEEEQTAATRANAAARTRGAIMRRIDCLDAFRGLTLAGMIFVNYGGAGYTSWEHTPWNGITPADFIFPFFIFSMGASIAISIASLMKHNPTGSLWTIISKIIRRSVILAVLGVCLNSKWVNYEQPDGLSKLRLTGVLQRFSISYLVVALMYTIELTLGKWIRAQSLTQLPYLSKMFGVIFEVMTAINYLALYVYFTFFFDYDPQCPVGYLGPGGQTEGGRYAACTGGAAGWIDRTILGSNHMYNDHGLKQLFLTQVSHDPEGFLGYTTSILLTLIGLQCGKLLVNGRTQQKRVLVSFAKWSVALVLASSVILLIPVNKRLWSLSFIVVTALAAFLLITMFYVLMDLRACKKPIFLKLICSAGKNPIFLYVGHSMLSKMLPWWLPVIDKSSHLTLLLQVSWATLVWLLMSHNMAINGLYIKI